MEEYLVQKEHRKEKRGKQGKNVAWKQQRPKNRKCCSRFVTVFQLRHLCKESSEDQKYTVHRTPRQREENSRNRSGLSVAVCQPQPA
ncbi:hypothetical protein Q3G72_023891 [Acer saccharum]|nr:hypothetical protein Q3G72_023891 [Acer saccharum]